MSKCSHTDAVKQGYRAAADACFVDDFPSAQCGIPEHFNCFCRVDDLENALIAMKHVGLSEEDIVYVGLDEKEIQLSDLSGYRSKNDGANAGAIIGFKDGSYLRLNENFGDYYYDLWWILHRPFRIADA